MRSAALLLFMAFSDLVLAQTGQVAVRVTDLDTKSVISNVEVRAGFNTGIEPGWGWGGGKPNRVTGYTGTNGVCTLTGSGDGGSVGISAYKEGYYRSTGYRVTFTNVVGTIRKRWIPWSPIVDVVLKQVGRPIPLYAKRIWETRVPATGQPVGFDLAAGDWISPHGKGQGSDLLFTYNAEPERVYTNWYGTSPRVHSLHDYRLSISFANDGDGVVPVSITPHQGGSALRLPPMAPEGGYVPLPPKRVFQQEGKPQQSEIRKDQNYFFRVRTKMDAKGNVISALYGKIHGDFQFDERGRISFTYYLNPTPNDRNVEFDPEKNLFRRLPSLEQVNMP